MNNKKYNVELTLLDKKDNQGKFTNKQKIKVLDVLELDDNIKIAFGYEGLKRKPSYYVCIYEGVATIISNNINEPIDVLMAKLNQLAPNASKAIINRYKELKLI